MISTRRAAFTVAALLAVGALAPVASTPAQAATTVTISGVAFDALHDEPFNQVDVLYANTSTYVPVDSLVEGQSLDQSQIAEDGRFTLSVTAGKAFYLRISSWRSSDYVENTFVGADGKTSTVYPALSPVVATTDLDLGAIASIKAADVSIATNLRANTYELKRLDGSTAYERDSSTNATSFTISGVAPGTYLATATGPFGTSRPGTRITVAAGVDATAKVTMTRYAKLTGKVLTSAGTALRNVSVLVKGPGGRSVKRSATNSSGTYSLTGLNPGSYKVTYAGATGTSASAYLDGATKSVTVAAGVTQTLDTVKLVKGGVVAGTVQPGSHYASVVLLTSLGSAASSSDGTSTKSGSTVSFRTRGVKSGTYTLLVQLDNGRYVKRKVTVTTGKVTTVGLVQATKIPVTVKGRISAAQNGFVQFTSKPRTDGRQAGVAFASLTSTGQFTAQVAPGTWTVLASGDSGSGMLETTSPREVTISASTTISVPVTKVTIPVATSVTFHGKPISGLYMRTQNDNPHSETYFTNNFYTAGETVPGTYDGSWGVRTPTSALRVWDEGVLSFEGGYYFATTVATVGSTADVKALSLVLKGGG